jgi:hypothetical protein
MDYGISDPEHQPLSATEEPGNHDAAQGGDTDADNASTATSVADKQTSTNVSDQGKLSEEARLISEELRLGEFLPRLNKECVPPFTHAVAQAFEGLAL